jgi:DNA mismatch repair protein MutL
MSKLIHPLPLQLANQLAAGEVVERPASVVKELLENSLDAGATQVHIEVEQGGTRLLRICDNGAGIHQEDLTQALSRHATSKIHTFYDLERIGSLGFRGEALASICSVSHLTLTSFVPEADSAWKIYLEPPHQIPVIEPAAHPQGTTIEVRDLFYNTPARRKFLRSEKTEFAHIEELIKRIALSQFAVDFTLKHNQKLIYRLRSALSDTEKTARIAKLCSQLFLQNSLTIELTTHDLRLWGWLGLPSFARNQNDLQYFYVNGRIIRDRLINHAIRQAYQDSLFAGKQPCFILFLEIDPCLVDVNVHPTKHEVRFRESRLVHDFISHQLRQALTQESSVTSLPEKNTVTFQKKMSYEAPRHKNIAEQITNYSLLHPTPSVSVAKNRSTIVIHNTYALVEDSQGLVIVSICEAKKQTVYQKLYMGYTKAPLKSQPLLIPSHLVLCEKEVSALLGWQEKLQPLGCVFEAFSPTTLTIRQLPSILREMPIDAAFKALANYILEKKHTALMEDICLIFATHTQVPTTNETIQQLVDDLENIQNDPCLSRLKPARR